MVEGTISSDERDELVETIRSTSGVSKVQVGSGNTINMSLKFAGYFDTWDYPEYEFVVNEVEDHIDFDDELDEGEGVYLSVDVRRSDGR